jgi:YHS domain-containing protein
MKNIQSIILLLFSIAPLVVFAQNGEVYTTKEGAIDGYDPVAFFKEQKPMKGNKEFVYDWNGAKWYFSSQANLNEFKANPEKYAPQYGGYCAYGTADGHKAPIKVHTWTVVNDKLYFNYNQDVKKLWNKNQKELILKADKNWPTVKKEK